MEVEDQLKRKLTLSATPKRIISCVPSTTELLFDLGLDEEVVGITKFCVHPEQWHNSKRRIGGTKKLHLDEIAALKPDLIICDKEENLQSEVEFLIKNHNVWVSNTNSLEEGLEMIQLIGALLGKSSKAEEINDKIKKGFDILRNSLTLPIKRPAAYLIWQEPMMVAGKGTFINDMMERCGLDNQFLFSKNGYPEVTVDQLQEANPDLVLLSSEPFPFAEKHIAEFQKMLPNADVALVDGEMFSWPGSRMVKASNYFLELVNGLRVT